MNRILIAVGCTIVSSGAFACGGGGYSGRDIDAARRSLVLAKLDSARIAQQIDRLDKEIAVVEAFDVVAGQVASLVPYGGAVYSSSQAVAYTAMGDLGSAKQAAISGVVGLMGSVASPYGTLASGVGFAIDANQAIQVGIEVSDAFKK